MEQITKKLEFLLRAIEGELSKTPKGYIHVLDSYTLRLIELYREVEKCEMDMKASIRTSSEIQSLLRIKKILKYLLEFILLGDTSTEDEHVFNCLFTLTAENEKWRFKPLLDLVQIIELKNSPF